MISKKTNKWPAAETRNNEILQNRLNNLLYSAFFLQEKDLLGTRLWIIIVEHFTWSLNYENTLRNSIFM